MQSISMVKDLPSTEVPTGFIFFVLFMMSEAETDSLSWQEFFELAQHVQRIFVFNNYVWLMSMRKILPKMILQGLSLVNFQEGKMRSILYECTFSAVGRLIFHRSLISFHPSPCLKNLLQFISSFFKLFDNFRVSADWAFHPWMFGDLEDSRTILRLKGDHCLKKIAESWRIEARFSFTRMRLPKSIQLVLFDKPIVRIVWRSFFERWVSRVHDKKNYSCSKNIHPSALILSKEYFRGHISFSTQFCLQHSRPIPAFQKTGEAEIGDFEYKSARKEQIFWFDISMRITLLMHVVNSIHHLVEVCPCNPLRKTPSIGYKVKKLSSFRILQNKSKTLNFLLVFIGVNCTWTHADKLDKVVMMEFLHDLQFLFDVAIGQRHTFKFFYSHFVTFRIECQVDTLQDRWYIA